MYGVRFFTVSNFLKFMTHRHQQILVSYFHIAYKLYPSCSTYSYQYAVLAVKYKISPYHQATVTGPH